MTASSTTYSHDDVALGAKVIGYALSVLQWGLVVAVTWSCSTLLMGIVMFLIMSLLMALLRFAAALFIGFNVSEASIAGLGHKVGSVTGRVSALFTRATAQAAA